MLQKTTQQLNLYINTMTGGFWLFFSKLLPYELYNKQSEIGLKIIFVQKKNPDKIFGTLSVLFLNESLW